MKELTKKQIQDKAYYLKNKEKILERAKIAYASDPEKKKAYTKDYRLKNLEKCKSAKKSYQISDAAKHRKRIRSSERYLQRKEELLARSRAAHHKNRDKRLAQKRAWAKENNWRSAHYATKRRAAKLAATPAWANEFFIEEAYNIAQVRSSVTGVPWEVDHIVPLISPRVCGLHVEHNLRVIPMVVNRSKANRFWPDMA